LTTGSKLFVKEDKMAMFDGKNHLFGFLFKTFDDYEALLWVGHTFFGVMNF